MAVLDELVLPRGVIFGDNAEPEQSIYTTSATANYQLGTSLIYGSGRRFRYARAGATNLSKCRMMTSEAHEADVTEIVQTGYAFATGKTDITMLVVTGAVGSIVAENELVGGLFFCNKVSGVGDVYEIIASKRRSTDTILDLKLKTGLRTAIAATTECSVKPSIYSNTIVAATTITGCPCGVPLVDVTAEYYYWSQVGGSCPIIVDAGDTVVVGEPAGKAGTNGDAGSVGVVANDGTDAIYGLVEWIGVADEPAIINLNLN